jgi:thiol-disulfide isomerase/thioredoxin
VSREGIDIVDLAPPGAAVDLVPVPGKLTIFDFWASWCTPCRVLEEQLLELASRHKDVVAIRRIDIVDADSPATKRHLVPGNYDLPHLKVYGPDGILLFEATAPPDALIIRLRSLLE